MNVKYYKQLVTSCIISPILIFFPQENVIIVDSKYDVVEYLNNSDLYDLRTSLFIERYNGKQQTSLVTSYLFTSDNYISYTHEELSDFDRDMHLQYPGNDDVSLNITEYDVNHVSLNIKTPYDGYLYFGDGYSKHWKAYVDGKPATIKKTNINFKSVYVPEGTHRVAFVFDPTAFRYSLYAYSIGNIIFLAGVFVRLLRSRKL